MTRYRVGFMYATDRNDITPIEAAEIDERMKSREWDKIFEVWSNADPETDSKKSDMLVNAKRLDAVVAYLKAQHQRELEQERERCCRALCFRCDPARRHQYSEAKWDDGFQRWKHVVNAPHVNFEVTDDCLADPIRRMTGGGECDHQWVGTMTASLPPKVIETHCGICGVKKP